MNKCIFVGLIGSDFFIDSTNPKVKSARFTLQVRDNANATKIENFACVAFNTIGNNMIRYCKKGSKVAVECHAINNNYKNKYGQWVKQVQFVVDRVDFLMAYDGTVAQPEFETQVGAEEVDFNFLGEDLPNERY